MEKKSAVKGQKLVSEKNQKNLAQKKRAKHDVKNEHSSSKQAPLQSSKPSSSDMGISVSKNENFSEWYTQLLQKAELIEYTDVSGCYVLRPRAYAIWEKVQQRFNQLIKEAGVKNAYFPLFIPESNLSREAAHVKGFTPEVAWVTHSGETKLNERLAVRPTSETIMYPAYSKWIRSHRDLPLLMNQWANVVRWEFKNPVPFLRSREFLWQEGHNVFATEKELAADTRRALQWYVTIFEELYAVPVLSGRKSEQEKFAGADYTLSVETFLPIGKAIQGATSHSLGQNFAKAFNIAFVDKDETKKYVWQNSWGLSTRSIGVMIMLHSDDKGLVLPPRVAENQVVIVPIFFETSKELVLRAARQLQKTLAPFAPLLDDREEVSPGWKFNDWELRGIPVRLEIGPKDIEKDQVVLVRRDTGAKSFVKIADLATALTEMLETIQRELLERARAFLTQSTVSVKNLVGLKKVIADKKMAFMPWCEQAACEERMKAETEGAKTLNIPFDSRAQGLCAVCGKAATVQVYVAKSY